MTIEEIKKEFSEEFCYSSDEEIIEWRFTHKADPAGVWNFFLPHLQPTEAVLRVLRTAVKYQEDKKTRDGILKADGIRYAISKVKQYLAERGNI